MCVLGQPESVDSVLTFPSGYDTLEYSWVKATAVSVHLRILFVTLQSTNNASQNQFARDSNADEQNKIRSPYRPHKRGVALRLFFAQSKGKRERRTHSLHVQNTVFITIQTYTLCCRTSLNYTSSGALNIKTHLNLYNHWSLG